MAEERFWRLGHDSQPTYLKLVDLKFERDEAHPQWELSLKWDGCCHLDAKMPEGCGESQYWHLCGGVRGIDEMIARLQEAKKLAEEFFTQKQHREMWGFKDGG